MKKISALLLVATIVTSSVQCVYTTEQDENNPKEHVLFTITNVTEYDELIEECNKLKNDLIDQANTSKNELIQQINESLKNNRQNAVITAMAVTSAASGIGLLVAGTVHVAQTSAKNQQFAVDSSAITYFASGLFLSASGYFGISLHDKFDALVKKQ